MTTIITRVYATEDAAAAVSQQLLENKFQASMLTTITKGADAHDAMHAAGVPKGAREAYAECLENGNAVLVVRAPFGGAQLGRQICDAHDPIDAGVSKPDDYVSTDMPAEYQNSILKDHPRFMSSGMYPSLSRGRSMIATMFGKPLRRGNRNLNTSLYRGTKFWANFPVPHLSHKPRNINNSIYRGTKYWANFPIPHLVKSERDPSLY